MRFSPWLGFLAALLGLACEPSPDVDFFQEVPPSPDFPGSAGDPTAYENLLAYQPNPGCAPKVLRKLERRTEVRIFTGYGIDHDTIVRYVGGLKRYYDYYGVTMFTRHDPIAVPLDHAVVFNESEIMDWMRNVAHVDPVCANSPSPSSECLRALGGAMFYNVKQFLRTYAEPELDVINIVLLKRVASLNPSPDASEMTWGVAGLGLSQELVNASSGSDVGSLADVLDETDFSPTVFIAVNLTDFILREPDIVIAHEFGHAYTLEHLEPSDYGANLMNPSAMACDLALNSSQLDTIERQTARYGNLLDPSRYDGVELVSLTHRAPEILDIVRARVAQAATEARP
jgi:hypothetical protein